MIPIQLIFQGLYSYQEKQTIDFTKLTGAGLFGIFGTVGSGKSSILEAIIYALYGRTSRLNLSGDNRYYNMMNLKSNQLLIDFIFKAGKEQINFRSVVKGKRNSKNFDDVKSLDRFTYKQSNNEWIPIETKELEQAVGLSYDNFRRTIIIPQGQFQEFLQLGNKDRTQMMKELFDLGKYEFSGKVTALETKNNALIQNIEGQLKQLENIDVNQIGIHQQQLDSYQQEIIQLESKYKSYQQKAGELNTLKELAQKLTGTKQQLHKLIELEPEYAKLENTITEYELCYTQFKHLLINMDDCDSRRTNKENQIKLERGKYTSLEKDMHFSEQKLEEIRPEYEQRDILKQKAQDFLHITRIKKLEEDIQKNKERLSKGTTFLNSTKTKIADLNKLKSDLEETVRNLKQDLPEMTLMVRAMTWHSENLNLHKQKSDIEAQLKKYKKEAEELNASLQQILMSPVFLNFQNKKSIQLALEFLEGERENIKQKESFLQQEGDELRLKDQLHQYAVELQDGKACPLCGSISHPQVYSIEDIHEKRLMLKDSYNNLLIQLENINSLHLQLNTFQTRIETNELNQKEWDTKITDKLAEIKTLRNTIISDKYRSKELLDADFKKANELQELLEQHDKSLTSLNKQIITEQENIEKYQTALDKINQEITIAETEAKTLHEQIISIEINNYKEYSSPKIEDERNLLLKEHVRLEKLFEKLNKQLESQRKEAHGLASILLTLEAELSSENSKLVAITKQVDEALHKYNYTSINDIRQVLNQPIQLQDEKKKLLEYRQHKTLLEERLNQLQEDINNRVYNPEDHQNVLGELETLSKKLGEIYLEVGKLSEMIKKLKEGLEQKEKLTEEHGKLMLRAENIRTMKQLFKASGFVNYVSSVYLQNLCNAANERFFQLTKQKLSLEITSDNNFQVRDFMNGGKTRSVKTLSGGQTFQAALSLALALADNIQKITESDQNFFFLDEGFGSLDKDSLSVVFETLKTLRKENRIVGVISHVEEMQQEIDVHLQIKQYEDNGSTITPSWTV